MWTRWLVWMKTSSWWCGMGRKRQTLRRQKKKRKQLRPRRSSWIRIWRHMCRRTRVYPIRIQCRSMLSVR